MTAAVIVTLAFAGAEAAAGWIGHSLALLSDAGHNLADAAALGLSWYALLIARRPSSAGMTFGYHRVAVAAALVNGLSLVGVSLWIGWEAIGRLRDPEPVDSGLMIGVALVAIVVNVAIGVRMQDGSRHDLNVRSAYLHLMGDALASLGVVVAGVIVAATGSFVADPVVSLLIAAFILWSSYGVCRESATVLLEGTPPRHRHARRHRRNSSRLGCARRPRSPCVDGRAWSCGVLLPRASRRAGHSTRATGRTNGRQ
jgi:cobalt-zinc-cadmium efflux system protein